MRYLKINSNTIKRSFRDLKGTNKDKIRVFSLVIGIYNKADGVKRSKR